MPELTEEQINRIAESVAQKLLGDERIQIWLKTPQYVWNPSSPANWGPWFPPYPQVWC